MEGDKKSFNLKYIDWKNIKNNVFHVTAEFEVSRTGSNETRRPDIVLFVNGIPLSVIECKRPDMKDPLQQAISQNIRNQKDDEIPGMFVYSQILMALTKNKGRYATTGTKVKFWSLWREEERGETELLEIINTPLTEEQRKKIFSPPFSYSKSYFDRTATHKNPVIKESKARYGKEISETESLNDTNLLELIKKSMADEILITEQDRLIYSIFRPDRFIELIYNFILYDCGEKKIARYQQYFAVKNTLERVKEINKEGKRQGGVIWHTQGSGKFLTIWKNTPFKGQLTAPSKISALKYKKYLNDFGEVSSEILISGPDTREGHEDVFEETKNEVQIFWKNMMNKYGNEKNYNKQLTNSFKNDSYPEIIIVVDKLLTGFDSPRNVVLYITRSLRDHTLLQAIARVNRLYENKE
jgi:type I site-specific restriction-modification system R (restriction) subunit